MIGFTVLYGSILVKNIRILMIFNQKKLRIRLISNCQLLSVLCAGISVDIAALASYTWAVDDQCGNPVETESWILLILVFLPKLLLVAAGIIVALKSRVIDIPEFNERHQLGYAFYNVGVTAVFLAPASLLITTDVSAAYALRVLAVAFMSVGTICILFVPKFIKLLRRGKLEGSSSHSNIVKMSTLAGRSHVQATSSKVNLIGRSHIREATSEESIIPSISYRPTSVPINTRHALMEDNVISTSDAMPDDSYRPQKLVLRTADHQEGDDAYVGSEDDVQLSTNEIYDESVFGNGTGGHTPRPSEDLR